MSVMKRAEWEKLQADTVDAQVEELRELCSRHVLSEIDHNIIGLIMCAQIAHLITLSDDAWEIFQRFVKESRRVQAIPHEQC